jgi:hypothetical protein
VRGIEFLTQISPFERLGSFAVEALASDPYFGGFAYLLLYAQFAFQPCFPTRGTKVPSDQVKNQTHPAMSRVKDAF